MTPNQLYALPPAEVSMQLYKLHNNLSEIDFDRLVNVEVLPRLELRYYADENFDGERGWELFSVFFDGKPVMICQAAGRGNRDYTNEFVTDAEAYRNLISYIESHYKPDEREYPAEFDPDVDLSFERFYGHELSEFYDPQLKPVWNVGDIVFAMVPTNHLRFKSGKTMARVKIERVEKYNPTSTYFGKQLDRRWPDDCNHRSCPDPVFDTNNGGIWARFADADVVARCPEKCNRKSKCDSTTPTHRHKMTGDFYCASCAADINRSSVTPNLIWIPTCEDKT